MESKIGILLILLVFIGCSEKPRTVEDYLRISIDFDKVDFTASTDEYSILLPIGWHTNEEIIDSDTLIYSMQAFPESPSDSNLCALSINKINVLSGDMSNEIDPISNTLIKAASNIKVIEKTSIKINGKNAKALHLGYEIGGEILQEEIDIFIPYNQNRYYLLTLLSDKNSQMETNFGIMLECAKTFKLRY